MKRVLCVFSLLGRGGAEGMCMNLMRHLNRDKVQFDFIKHGDRIGSYEEEIRALGGKVYAAPVYMVYNHIQYCAWWKKFLAEHPEYQIIHGHYYTPSSIYLKIARKMKRVTIAHSHSTHELGFVKNFLVKRVEGVADYQFACGDEAGKWMFPHSDFKVIKNAIDSTAFKFNPMVRTELRKTMNLENAFVIGAVGQLGKPKNPFGMIEIVEAISKAIPNIRMLWAGDGPMKTEVEERIKDKGLEQTITLLGSRGDIPRLLQAMDVLLMPSFFEGLPVSLIEAQAAGLPVLCSEAITNEVNVTGLCKFLPLGNVEAWVDAIKEVDVDQRKDVQDIIIQSGYDADSTARWMEYFYLNL